MSQQYVQNQTVPSVTNWNPDQCESKKYYTVCKACSSIQRTSTHQSYFEWW